MDKTTQELLSLVSRNESLLTSVPGRFAHTAADNPLNELGAADRGELLGLVLTWQSLREVRCGDMDAMERAAEVARDGSALADRIKKHVLTGYVGNLLKAHLEDFQRLTSQLQLFSETLGMFIGRAGKPGHKHRTLANLSLIVTSEFVKIKTGSYNDEHLAELIQAVDGNLASKDFSGDAIRKKREKFRRDHRDIFVGATRLAAKMASKSGRETQKIRVST